MSISRGHRCVNIWCPREKVIEPRFAGFYLACINKQDTEYSAIKSTLHFYKSLGINPLKTNVTFKKLLHFLKRLEPAVLPGCTIAPNEKIRMKKNINQFLKLING